MAVTRTAPPAFATTDGLAVPAGGVVPSGAMTVDPEAKLARAKDRLYVLCQVGGWGLMLAIQLFYQSLGTANRNGTRGTDEAITIMVMLHGLLLTHYARILVKRWGWMELGWAALLPRVVGICTAMSIIWSAIGFGWVYGVVQLPWTSKLTPVFAISATTFNGICVFLGWFCVYFVYQAFERVRRMQVERLHLAASVKEAELRALKSQVNPHFLFNSLNSLRALIDEDAPRARESVTRLANMLRYSLQSGQQETVPLEDELRIVEDYLALEMIRHESRLRVQWAVADEARPMPVPPMLLQTLVENAVKYGISPRREGGEIVIAVALAGAALHISVSNPGDLAAPATAVAARAGSSTGVGLRNASDRLKLLFGDRAKLTLRAEPAGCVTADVSIPLPTSSAR